MNVLDRFGEMGLKVTWKLIALGLHGIGDMPALLTRGEVCDYLVDRLVIGHNHTDSIIDLLCENGDCCKFDELLSSYALEDKSLNSIQLRKWKVYVLGAILSTDYYDYLQGLLALMEFWTIIADPEDCPHELPDNVTVLVNDFFTDTTFKTLLEKNAHWLENEVTCIAQLEQELDSL